MIYITTQSFPPTSGGIESLMASLAHYAVEAGETVHVLADGGKSERAYDARMQARYTVERFSGLKPLRRRRKARALAKADRNGEVDYIVADSWKSAEHLPASNSAPLTIFAHGNEYPDALTKQSRIHASLSKVGRVISVSQDTATRMIPFLPDGMSPDVLHPPVLPAAAVAKKHLQRAQALWPSDGIRILTLCRLVELKGIDVTLAAVASLRKDGIPIQLVIAGNGPDRDRLEELSKALNIAKHVNFIGRIEGAEKSALYQSAEIFAQPGRKVGHEREGFGISYLEAALHGLPSICGNEGGAPEAVLNNETGLIVDGTHQTDVTEALRKLTTDKKLRMRLSKAAKDHGHKALWSNQIDSILSAVKSARSN